MCEILPTCITCIFLNFIKKVSKRLTNLITHIVSMTQKWQSYHHLPIIVETIND